MRIEDRQKEVSGARLIDLLFNPFFFQPFYRAHADFGGVGRMVRTLFDSRAGGVESQASQQFCISVLSAKISVLQFRCLLPAAPTKLLFLKR
jgi:hypothetical protein